MVRSTIAARVVACASIALISIPAIGQATRPADLPSLNNTSVSIPWTELTALLERTRGKAGPPVDFVFSPATYTVTVGPNATPDAVTVVSEVDVTVLREGYALAPIASAEAAVESVRVDGQPAALVAQDGRLSVLLTGEGKKRVTVSSRRPIVSEGGVLRVDLPIGSAPINTLAVSIPGSVDARAAGAAFTTAEVNGVTALTATYRGNTNATVSWRPKQAAADVARVYADSDTRVVVRRGLVRYHTTIHASIERGSVRSVRVRIDPKAVLMSASGKDVAASREQIAGDVRMVTVDLATPAEGRRDIEVVYEKDVPEAGGTAAIVTPVVEGARRDAGVVSVESDGAYEIRPAAGNATLERIGVAELPQALRGAQATLAYRYTTPGSTDLSLTAIKPKPAAVTALTLTRIAVDRGVLRCQATVAYQILHAGVDTFRLTFPAGAELVSVEGAGVRDTQLIDENNQRFLLVGLKDVARKEYSMTVNYDVRLAEQAAAPAAPAAANAATRPASQPAVVATATVPVVGHPDAVHARGYVGIEVRGGYELSTTLRGAQRIDVRELPRQLWSMARAPMLEGYRYDAGVPTVSLSATRHQDLDVLVAMSDVCEATTTFTADGRSVTKVMYVVRNNLKPFMTMRLPEGAQVWSTFVDDRPVTPTRTADGRVLVTLKRSDEADPDEHDGYRSKRERRRQGEEDVHRAMEQVQKAMGDEELATDLKPYDVEVVFVMPATPFAERGQLPVALPQVDVPVGHMAWAIFLPKHLRVVEAQGSVNEVARFTLPFRHFGEAEYVRMQKAADQAKAMAQQAQALQKLAEQSKQIAEASKVAGVLPVRVEIPVAGEIYRFEKLLLVDEAPKTTLTYSRRLE